MVWTMVETMRMAKCHQIQMYSAEELTGFAEQMDVGYEEMSRAKDQSKCLVWSRSKNVVSVD